MKIKISPSSLLEAIRSAKIDKDGDYLIILEERQRVTPDDYYRFDELLEKWGVNLKDLRELIKLSYSYWQILRLNPTATDEVVFKYYNTNKGDIKDEVYSEETITGTLKAISKASSISSFLYSQLKKINPEDYQFFGEYYKKLIHYGD